MSTAMVLFSIIFFPLMTGYIVGRNHSDPNKYAYHYMKL